MKVGSTHGDCLLLWQVPFPPKPQFPHCSRRALNVLCDWPGPPQPRRSAYREKKSPYRPFFLLLLLRLMEDVLSK